jgi:hypothetical protein
MTSTRIIVEKHRYLSGTVPVLIVWCAFASPAGNAR